VKKTGLRRGEFGRYASTSSERENRRGENLKRDCEPATPGAVREARAGEKWGKLCVRKKKGEFKGTWEKTRRKSPRLARGMSFAQRQPCQRCSETGKSSRGASVRQKGADAEPRTGKGGISSEEKRAGKHCVVGKRGRKGALLLSWTGERETPTRESYWPRLLEKPE